MILIKIFKIKFIVLITLTVFLSTALLSGCSTIKSLIEENIGKSPDAVTESAVKSEPCKVRLQPKVKRPQKLKPHRMKTKQQLYSIMTVMENLSWGILIQM